MKNFFIALIAFFVCTNVVAMAGLVKVAFESATTEFFPAREWEGQLVSVIVAARNEEAHIHALLAALLRQTHQPLEILLVSDRSTDATEDIVQSYAAYREGWLKLIRVDEVPKGVAPKKYALQRGIRAAAGEALFLTDADCIPPSTWISETLKGFDEKTGVVIGYSPFRKTVERATGKESLFNLFQRYEGLRSAILAAGAVGRGAPYMATGRNLAYRRTAFVEAGGFEPIKHITSGDDDLLLQQIAKRTKWGIKYLISAKTFVETAPQATWTDFLNQKSRHTSAAFYYRWSAIAFLGLYHSINFLMLLCLLPLHLPLSFLMLRHGFKTFAAPEFSAKMFYLEPLYALYSLFQPMLAFRKFSWKA